MTLVAIAFAFWPTIPRGTEGCKKAAVLVFCLAARVNICGRTAMLVAAKLARVRVNRGIFEVATFSICYNEIINEY